MQTPAYSFPIEPHSLLPGAHWLPAAPAPASTGGWGRPADWEDISLLRRGEMEALFGPARAGALRPRS